MPIAPTREQYLAIESQRWSALRDRAFTVALSGAELEILCSALQLVNSVEAPRLFQSPPGMPPAPELAELRQLVTMRGELHRKLTGLAG